MALNPGTILGPYEVLSAIGAAGMGEVYKARDTKLDRDVALKILPDAFVNDPERLAQPTERFLMVRRGGQSAADDGAPRIIFVECWLDELERLVPTP